MSAATRHGSLTQPGIGKKQARTAIYLAEGGKLLFVPLESMWEFRDAAQNLVAKGQDPSIANIARALNADAHAMEAKVGHWRKLLGAFDWFNAWLFGSDAPAHVYVASLDQIRRCRAAWDYIGFLASAKVRIGSYYRWLSDRQLVPDLSSLKYLFGAKPPEGWFLIGRDLQKLRKEKTRARILEAAGIGSTTCLRWKRDKTSRAALKEALRVASGSGNRRELDNRCEAWQRLHTKTKNHMWDYAIAATIKSCCERAGIEKKYYFTLMTKADRAGVKADVKNYLRSAKRSSEGKSLRAGLVAKNLYVPTSRILKFRTVAALKRTQQGLSKLLDIPGFNNWFLDSVIPWSNNGQRLPFPGVENVRAPLPHGTTWSEVRRKEAEDKPAVAVAILRAILADAPVEANEVKRLARQADVSLRQLFRAKDKLKVTSEKVGWSGLVLWCMPGQVPQGRPSGDSVSPGSVPTSQDRAKSRPSHPGTAQTDDQQSTPRPQVSSDGKGERHLARFDGGPSSKYPGHAKKLYRTGRRRDSEREVVLEFVYELYKKKSRPEVRQAAINQFGPKHAPTDDEAVKTMAKEWANRFEPPLPWGKG